MLKVMLFVANLADWLVFFLNRAIKMKEWWCKEVWLTLCRRSFVRDISKYLSQAAATLVITSSTEHNAIQYNWEIKIKRRQAYKYNYKYEAIISTTLQQILIQCYSIQWSGVKCCSMIQYNSASEEVLCVLECFECPLVSPVSSSVSQSVKLACGV